ALRPAARPRRAVSHVPWRRSPPRAASAGSLGGARDVTRAALSPPRVAVVTGGTRGIGFGIARALARDGWRLALCGRRSAETVRSAVEELEGLGADVLYRVTDVARTSDHAPFVSAVLE